MQLKLYTLELTAQQQFIYYQLLKFQQFYHYCVIVHT